MAMVRKFTQAQFQTFFNQGFALSKQVKVDGPEDAEILMSEYGAVRVSKDVSILRADGTELTTREFEKRLNSIFNHVRNKLKARRLNNAFRLVSYRIQLMGEEDGRNSGR